MGRKGTPFAPEEPDKDIYPKLYADILAADVLTPTDASEFAKLLATGTDAHQHAPHPVPRQDCGYGRAKVIGLFTCPLR
jgi:hypothetical protein